MRAQRTMHVFVDANYGDDTLAQPVPAGQNPASPFQPHAPVTGAPTGNNNEAPYSFRTVTAALAYVYVNIWPSLDLDPDSTAPEFVVVHVAPGLYGPTGPGAIDSDSGLPWSGETFPLDIRQHVSIQGTSALDTIFDARLQTASIFNVRGVTPVGAMVAKHTFIDGVTIRGARGTFGPRGSRFGCGVLIDHEPTVMCSISNCFITDNQVGVAIIADDPDWDFDHAPAIVGNTFVFNEIGIWNGSWTVPPGASQITGLSKPLIANNVFDTSTPVAGARPSTLIGISAFEGVASAGVTMQVGVLAFDSNAYELTAPTNRIDIGNTAAPPTVWPRTVLRTGTAVPATPAVDVTPFTNPSPTLGAPSTNRGALFIADIFRIDPTTQVAGVPRSRHDFRLAPEALTSSTATSGVLNPLINVGIDGSTAGLTAVNGTSSAVGLPSGAEPTATLTGWDHDCDGAFNPRVSTKEFVLVVGPAGFVDIGADEMSSVVISGYLDNTRIFSSPHFATAPSLPSRTRLFFFNLFRGPSAFYARPQFNAAIDFARVTPTAGVTSAWYDQLLNHPYQLGVFTVGNYTDGAISPLPHVPTTREQDVVNFFTGGPNVSPPFMRNLVCDVSPHLYHATRPNFATPTAWPPYWADDLVNFPNRDIFHTNPWFAQTNPPDVGKDNDRLFHDPSTGRTLRLGILNPPVTVIANDLAPNSFLFADGVSHPSPAVLNWNANPGFIYQVNPLGWGDTFAAEFVPTVPGHDWQGARYNVELFSPGDPLWATLGAVNNLQTFLVVQGETLPPAGAALEIDQSLASQPAVRGVPLTAAGSDRMEKDRAAAAAVLESWFKEPGPKR